MSVYPAVPREPVRADSPYARNLPTTWSNNSALTSVYEDFDLGYYQRFYNQYPAYILTQSYRDMKSNLDNDSLVCVNYAVVNNNTWLGLFACPLPFEYDDLTMCCGEKYAEFCCFAESSDRVRGIIAFVCIIGSVVGMGVIAYCLLGSK